MRSGALRLVLCTGLLAGSLVGSSTIAGPTNLAQLAQADGDVLEKAPPVQCDPNEQFEWHPNSSCGFNDAGAPIGAEMRCWNYYDASQKACVRKCVPTGKCHDV